MIGADGYSFIADSCGKTTSMFAHEKEFDNFKINRMNESLILA